MPSYQNSAEELLSYLKMQGPCLSGKLVAHYGLSRQTLSRRVQEMGHNIVTIGKGRATRLAARHPSWPGEVPLYQVQENGQVELFGKLHPLQAGTQIQWYLMPEKTQPSLMQNEFKEGLFPGWPWFLEDLRPAGFLGRAFSKHMSEVYSLDADAERWNDFDLLRALRSHGYNLQGNFILGDGRALSRFQTDRVRTNESPYRSVSPETYIDLAAFAMTAGEELGSSAGGEQPKFTIMVCDTPEAPPRAVIVKFSPRLDTSAGQRWFDLLHAEHIANQVLSEAGMATAQTRLFRIEDRLFLESERFDRVGTLGRKGLVSLRALDAAYIGMGNGSWANVARKLHADKWISETDRDRMIQLHCFGEMIANTDMHWGNLSFFLPEAPPFPLAPAYDMLPMFFRPSSTGEIIRRSFEPTLPKPEDQAVWLEMYPHALLYWQRIQQSSESTPEFRQIAQDAITSLKQIHKIAVTS